MEEKIALALGARAGHPRRRPTGTPGLLGRLLRRAGGGGAGLDDRHPVHVPADHGVPLGRCHRRRGRRLADRHRIQRGPVACPSRPRRGHGRRRSARHPAAGCAKGPIGPVHGRLRPPCRVHAALRGVLRALGRGRGQGALVLRREDRRVGGQRRRHPDRRPDRQPGVQRVGLRRRGAGLPAQRPHLRRRPPDVRLRHGLGPPGADPLDRLRRPRGLLGHALRRVPGPGAHPRGR